MEHGHSHSPEATPGERVGLATSATVHCPAGCGLAEVVGVVLGVALGLTRVGTITLAVSLGFVFGFALGVIPLFRAGYTSSWIYLGGPPSGRY